MTPTRATVGVLGAVYLVIGILGFLDPLVAEATHPDMETASGDLFGLFPINAVHNIVHLVIGAALLYGATGVRQAILTAWVIAAAYAVVGLLGIFAPDTFGLMPIGGNDIWLHFATAAILFGVTLLEDRTPMRRTI